MLLIVPGSILKMFISLVCMIYISIHHFVWWSYFWCFWSFSESYMISLRFMKLFDKFSNEFTDASSTAYPEKFSTDPWHNTWRRIALLLLYAECYIWSTVDCCLILLPFVCTANSSLFSKKIHFSSGEILWSNRSFHPNIDDIAALVS